MSTVPTCPGVCAVSRASNDTSTGVRRCGMTVLPCTTARASQYATTAAASTVPLDRREPGRQGVRAVWVDGA